MVGEGKVLRPRLIIMTRKPRREEISMMVTFLNAPLARSLTARVSLRRNNMLVP